MYQATADTLATVSTTVLWITIQLSLASRYVSSEPQLWRPNLTNSFVGAAEMFLLFE